MTEELTVNEAGAMSNSQPLDTRSMKTITIVVYALQAGSFLLGITAVIGVIVNYLKQADVRGTWLESHFRWQIRTFWFGMLWMIIGTATVLIGVGAIVLVCNAVWVIYRIVRGWLALNDEKAMYLK